MKKLALGSPVGNTVEARLDWLTKTAIPKIVASSFDTDAFDVADGFSVTNVAETRSLDPTTAQLSDVANFIATFISDMQKRGQKRTG